jgi:D-inositol-3-phosphate glycosyltransferase
LCVDDGVNGFMVPGENPQSMAVAIQALVEQPLLRARFSAAARQKAVQFGLDQMVDATLELYWKLIGSGGSAAAPVDGGDCRRVR